MKKKTLLTSILTIVMCLSLMVGGTFALFTSESKVNVAVTSGKVSVTATIDQNSVETKQLYDTAYKAGVNNMYEGEATFNEDGLTLEKFVPGDGIKFNIVVNNESNVTVKYRTIISCENDNGLFAGLLVNIADKQNYDGKEYVTNWANLEAGNTLEDVEVSIELPETAGNEYKEKTCTISYKVEAIQGNAKTENVSTSTEVNGTATEDVELKTNGADSPVVEVSAELLNDIVANDSTIQSIALKHSEPKYDATNKTVSFDNIAIVNQNGEEVDLTGNTKLIKVTLPAEPAFANKTVYVYHDGEHIATEKADANGVISYETTHFCEVAVSTKVLYNNVRVSTYEAFAKVIADAQTAKKDIKVVLDNDITITKQLIIGKGINVTIDLNGYDIDAEVSTSEVIKVNNDVAGNSLTITSSKPYAQINVGGKSLVLAYNDVAIENVEIRVGEIKSSSYQTIKMQTGALVIKNTEFNVSYLGTSLITAASSVTVEDSIFWINTFKTWASGIISCNDATKLVLKNITGSITLDTTYTQYLVTKAQNVTMENFNANIVDLKGNYYEIVMIEDEAAGNKLGFNKIDVEAIYAALAKGEDVSINGNLVMNAEATNGYGATGLNVFGGTLDMNGKTLKVNASGTWGSAINITSGTIKNVNLARGFRGIFINHNSDAQGKVYLENVIIDGPTYTISCDQGTGNGLEATNCTFNGWTSYASTIGDVKFTNCNFGEGAGNSFCRPYANTEFANCNFEAGYEFDARATISFENCYYDGVLITAENVATLVTNGIGNVTIK